jgi:hypothetical protein
VSLRVVPLTLRSASALVDRLHRHHEPPRGCLFCLGAAWSDTIVASAIVGRPVARHLQDGLTAEVIRLATDEAWEDAFALGRAAGSWFLGRERGLRGLAHAGFVLGRGLGSGAASMLYAAAWRACKAIGYRRLVTYTLPEEGGASLRASGWALVGAAGGGEWGRPSRPREAARHPTQEKLRWELTA